MRHDGQAREPHRIPIQDEQLLISYRCRSVTSAQGSIVTFAHFGICVSCRQRRQDPMPRMVDSSLVTAMPILVLGLGLPDWTKAWPRTRHEQALILDTGRSSALDPEGTRTPQWPASNMIDYLREG